ncbi:MULTISPECIES: LptE family protein [Aestuariibaculum]|uniref:LPS assembly lipoprotein LptE n=1 Tax=Aestuariibaculum lutulentum TaxID=2920935 RepID=A0ABS9RJK6_9FLAO|nr:MULTISPECIES: LptE family protein [Aestuariibaculum]MCH4553134.1 LPS assembly lipoprotein LptE [Aestuariibaculum lutulentum]MCR8668895.1 LPS assembly lipoprotein LptE [Aestuariibaculum sp. M13]
MKKHFIYLSFLALSFTLLNCGIYSFTGASVPANVKTFQVNRFENTALLFEPGLDLEFQNTLQDLIQNQTNLSLVTTNGDLLYEGEITDYRISPTTATSQNTAAQNRLTISVKVRFFNKKKEEDDLEQSFSFFYDYPGSSLLTGSQKATAHEEIFQRLTQDIFNATLAKW